MMMQAVMWVILGATIGLAALVSGSRGRGPPALIRGDSFGVMRVSLPGDWVASRVVAPPGAGGAPVMMLRALEPSEGDEAGRALTLTQEQTTPAITPEDYLNLTSKARLVALRVFTIGGRPGVRALTRGDAVFDLEEGRPAYALVGCTVLPSGVAVTLRLEGLGRPGADDDRLFTRIADSIVFTPE